MDARAAGISRRRFAAIGGLWRPQLTPTDSIRPYSTLPNRYSTTRKRIREAAAESSSSWSLGEYAVSIRSDFRSTASLPPRPQHAATLQDAIRLYSDHYNPVQAKCNLTRGKLRRARSNAPQRFEASSWASCRTTADASSFCESRAVRHICRTSSTQMSRSRVTFVTLPATPRPVPSKKRQRFILCNSYRGGFAAMPRLLRSSPGNSRFLGTIPAVIHDHITLTVSQGTGPHAPYGRAVSDAPPHSGLSPIAVFRHYSPRQLICIVPFTRRGPSLHGHYPLHRYYGLVRLMLSLSLHAVLPSSLAELSEHATLLCPAEFHPPKSVRRNPVGFMMSEHWPRGIVVTRLYEKGSLALSLIRSSGETRTHRSRTRLRVLRIAFGEVPSERLSPFCGASLHAPPS